MKAILISIKPRFVADILNGKKTIEIRKTRPTFDQTPIEVFIYCTKSGGALYLWDDKKYYVFDSRNYKPHYCLNGKVIAKFTLKKAEDIWWKYDIVYEDNFPKTKTLETRELLNKSCLGEDEFNDYVGDNFSYAWHIEDLVVFDRPRDIKEFKVHWPPQSWQFIEI